MGSEKEMEMEPRVGSILTKVVPIKWPWHRSSDKDRRIIRRQLLEHVKLSGTLRIIEHEMKRRMEKASWRDLAEEFEWFTMHLLEGLKMRGIVEWHVWQQVCFDSYKVDVDLGIDHFGELSDEYANTFFMINTKATEEALGNFQKRGRAGILGFRARCPLVGASDGQLRAEEDRLLAEILDFFTREVSVSPIG